MIIIDLTHLYAATNYPTRNESLITDFIVHHSQGQMPTSEAHAHKLIQAIHDYHRSKWPGIAYHRAAWEEYYFLLRPRSRNGWHTGGMDLEPRNGIGDANDKGVACCILGTHTYVAPSQRTLQTVAEGKEWDEQQLGRSLALSGHQDHAATACPGEGWKFWRQQIKSSVTIDPSPCEGIITALAHTADIVIADRLGMELARAVASNGHVRKSVVQSAIDDAKAIREQFIGARP